MTEIEQHDPEDRCFYCATDSELGRSLRGEERRTIRMDLPATACPTWQES